MADSQQVLKDRKITETDIEYLKIALKNTLSDLEEHGPSILPHLSDTDENAGEQLRYFMWKCGLGDMKGIKNSVYKHY